MKKKNHHEMDEGKEKLRNWRIVAALWWLSVAGSTLSILWVKVSSLRVTKNIARVTGNRKDYKVR